MPDDSRGNYFFVSLLFKTDIFSAVLVYLLCKQEALVHPTPHLWLWQVASREHTSDADTKTFSCKARERCCKSVSQ